MDGLREFEIQNRPASPRCARETGSREEARP